MKFVLTLTCLIGLICFVRVGAAPLIEGRVRLDSGEPVADAQVRIFDMSDLRPGAIARATTDGTGYFALPLAALTSRALPQRFALGQNYPNPFNPSTIIPYQLAVSSAVRLEVFNLLGQRLATLVDGERPAGFHTATWHATDGAGRAVGAGVYIYRITVAAEHQTGRMVLLDGQAGVSASGTASVVTDVSGVGEPAEGVYGLIVSGRGLAPYVDSSFRVEAGMAPVELVVSAGQHPAGKATDDDCALCGLFDTFDDLQEEEEQTEEETEEEETEEEDQMIPDANLRAAIAKALGKASGATITKDEMKTLTRLERNLTWAAAQIAGIRDLTGLEFAINLRKLWISTLYITDVSPLAGLTNLRDLRLDGNAISDVSPLSGLTNLTYLDLFNNNISDVSPLAGLTNLTELRLGNNTISDVSPLSGLTNLTYLQLNGNTISDISPLLGLTNLTWLGLNWNPLNVSSINDYIPALLDRGIDVSFGLTGPVTDDPTPVTIPDAKLREKIEAKLGKASGETITRYEMSVLPGYLFLRDAYISDLTGLEFATNLTFLELISNTISDVSPLSGLTNLRDLRLDGNAISDVSPLSGLTNLTYLDLFNNNISDVSPLAGLTNLRWLRLQDNAISDVSPLLGLTNLTELELAGNLLNVSSVNDHIPLFESRGVTVSFDPFVRESPFNIELVFLADFSAREKRIIEYAARRWMSIIREDLPDYTFTGGLSAWCGEHSYRIPAGERIDDLRIYITNIDDPDSPIGGWANTDVLRETSYLPVVGCMALKKDSVFELRRIALHEIAHVLGFTADVWNALGFLQNPPWENPNADPYFNGPLAIAAFNDAGGRNYTGAKVPLDPGSISHWYLLKRELMAYGTLITQGASDDKLSAITLQSLADLGYSIDVTQAHPYTFNPILLDAMLKPSAKVAAPSTHAEPEWSCGTGQHQEPIYVVDPQGNIIRTLHR